MRKINMTALAGLITSLVAVGGFVFGVIQYSIDSKNQEKIQRASYEATAKGLDNLSSDVTNELKRIHDDIQSLKIEVAVLRERTRHMHSISLPMRDVDGSPAEARIPKIRQPSLKEFSVVQKNAIAE